MFATNTGLVAVFFSFKVILPCISKENTKIRVLFVHMVGSPGWLPDSHPAAPSRPSSAGPEEKTERKSLWAEIKIRRSLTN